MRFLQILLVIILAGTMFFVSYVGTRISMHRDPVPDSGAYSRLVDDVVYAVTEALPASLPDMAKDMIHWPDVKMPHVTMPHLGLPHWHVPSFVTAMLPHESSAPHAVAKQKKLEATPADVDDPTLNEDVSDAKLAKEPVPGVEDATPKPAVRKAQVHRPKTVVHSESAPKPVEPHAQKYTGMVEAQSKPTMSIAEMLRITKVRAKETMIANVSASRGGIIRFSNGSFLAIAPKYLPHDIAVSVALSSPALPETAAFDATGDAMIISFKPLADGVAYAEAAPTNSVGAVAGIALTNAQRMRLNGRLTTFVKRVYLRDGTSTDFEETPTSVTQVMTADLAEDHVLNFTAHVRGTIVVSLQRAKSDAIAG